jgi:predicted PurR-regulated permease PerM
MPQNPEEPTAFNLVWRSPWVRAATYLVIIGLIIWILIALYPRYAFVLNVAIVGFVVAYILNPVVDLLRRIRIGRPVAVVLVYLVLIALAVFGSILVGQVAAQLGEFIQRIPAALEKTGASVGTLTSWLGGILNAIPDFIAVQIGIESGSQLTEMLRAQLATGLTRLTTSLANFMENLVMSGGADAIVSGAASIISTTTQVVLTLLVSAYFLWDFPRFTANFYRLVPVRWRAVYSDVTSKADLAVGGYLRGQIVVTTLVGMTLWIGLSILGVPLALAISFLAAIFNLVPYLGPILGLIPAMLLGFSVSPLTGILVIVVFVIANQLESNLLSPLILSKNVNIHPVTVLLAIIAGFSLYGFVGALLAVPGVALFKILYESYVMTLPAYQSGPFRYRQGQPLIAVPEEQEDDEGEGTH